jgi:hypothetical protein
MRFYAVRARDYTQLAGFSKALIEVREALIKRPIDRTESRSRL